MDESNSVPLTQTSRSGQVAQAGPLSFAARGSLKLAAGKVSGVAVDVPWGRNVPALVAIAAGEVPTLVLLPVEGASACTLRSNTAGEARDEFVYESAVPLLAVPLPALKASTEEGAKPGQFTARVMDADGKVDTRTVTVGVRNRLSAEVLQGLREGELLVTGEQPAGSGSSRFQL